MLKTQNGKGSSPRNNYSRRFRENYDQINWGKKKVKKFPEPSVSDKDYIERYEDGKLYVRRKPESRKSRSEPDEEYSCVMLNHTPPTTLKSETVQVPIEFFTIESISEAPYQCAMFCKACGTHNAVSNGICSKCGGKQ